jgi:MbtH protein
LLEDERDERVYAVVVNDEEQYSIWSDDSELPAGWHKTGMTGPRAACLSHVDEVWVDMRPLSLRGQLEGDVGAGAVSV